MPLVRDWPSGRAGCSHPADSRSMTPGSSVGSVRPKRLFSVNVCVGSSPRLRWGWKCLFDRVAGLLSASAQGWPPAVALSSWRAACPSSGFSGPDRMWMFRSSDWCTKLVGVLPRFSKWLQTWSPELIFELAMLTFRAESFCGGSQGPTTSYFPSSRKSCCTHDILELGRGEVRGP